MNELSLQVRDQSKLDEAEKTVREDVFGRVFHPISKNQPLLINLPFNILTIGDKPLYKSEYSFRGIPFDILFKACSCNLVAVEAPFDSINPLLKRGNYISTDVSIPSLFVEAVFDINRIEDYDALKEWFIKINLNNIIYRMPLFDYPNESRDQVGQMVGYGYRYIKSQLTRDSIYRNTVLPFDMMKLSEIEMQFIPHLHFVD